MMQNHDYTIDDKFIFEQSTCRIYLKEDQNKSIELSKPAARLFSGIILLNLQNGIATRDELLINVWEVHGLVGSNNNLNTYLSEIRKKLEIVGIDPKSIVTVPKKGFRLDNHIAIHENGRQSIENADIPADPQQTTTILITSDLTSIPTSEAGSQEAIAVSPQAKIDSDKKIVTISHEIGIQETPPKKRLIKLIFLTILTLTACYLVYLFIYNSTNKINEKNDYITLESRGNCIIQIPADMARRTSKDNLATLNNKLDKYNISCDEPKRIILLSDLNRTYSFDKNTAISICKKTNSTYDCVSINDQRI